MSTITFKKSPTSFQSLKYATFPHSTKQITAENKYWKTYNISYTDNLHLNVPFLRFSKSSPYDCSVISNRSLRLYTDITHKNSRLKFSNKKRLRFHIEVYCSDIRLDNKLIGVGGDKGLLRIYNNTKSHQLDIIRTLKGHKGNVNDIRFNEYDLTKILSCGNDKTIRYWDVSLTEQLECIQGHKDFVRCGEFLDNSSSLFISGSYDHYCKIWDLRDIKKINNNNSINLTFESSTMTSILHKANISINHKYPIEAILNISSSNDLICIAGGPNVSIWSLKKYDKPITTINIHRKTVTSLCINKEYTRLLTGCLDNCVRVFDTNEFKIKHTFDIGSGIRSLDLSQDNMVIAIGTHNKGLIFKRRNGIRTDIEEYLKQIDYEKDPNLKLDDEMRQFMDSGKILRDKSLYNSEQNNQKNLRYGSRDWFIRGQKLKEPNIPYRFKNNLTSSLNIDASLGASTKTMIVEFKSPKKLKLYEKALKEFRYGDALDLAINTSNSIVVYSVLDDLWRRDGLEIALSGRNNFRLQPILEYLIYSLGHPHLSSLAIHVTSIVLDLYKNVIGLDSNIDNLFNILNENINNLLYKYKILLKLQGNVEMILSNQDIRTNKIPNNNIMLLSKKIKYIINKSKQLTKNKNDKNDNKPSPMHMDID